MVSYEEIDKKFKMNLCGHYEDILNVADELIDMKKTIKHEDSVAFHSFVKVLNNYFTRENQELIKDLVFFQLF